MDQRNEAPRIGVVLLNWNGGEDTLPCIASLKRGTLRPWRITVVDNASSDSSPDEIARQHPDVDLVRSQVNLGFASGNNLGIRRLLDAGADAVWVLNNDTEVAVDCLEKMFFALRSDPGVGALTAKIFYADPPGRLWYAGGLWNNRTMQATHRGQFEQDHGQYDEAEDVAFISGCCMLITRDALERAGHLSDDFFIYMEDTDWCQRACSMGIRLRYEPSARLLHKVSASMTRNALGQAGGRVSPMFIYLTTRNQLWIIRRHGRSAKQKILAVIMNAPSWTRTLITVTLLGRWSKAGALLRGLRDGIRQTSSVKGIPVLQRQ